MDNPAESTDGSEANSRGSLDDSGANDGPYQNRSRGIKSSWTGTRSTHKPRVGKDDALQEEGEELSKQRSDAPSQQSQNVTGRVALEGSKVQRSKWAVAAVVTAVLQCCPFDQSLGSVLLG